jgi:hypothetical protein
MHWSQRGVHSWEVKIAEPRSSLISDNRREEAQAPLRSTISSFPYSNESNGLRAANTSDRSRAGAIAGNVSLIA